MEISNKSFFLGLGIGIISLSALFYFLYTARVENNNLIVTDTMIIEKAKALGMVFFDELKNENNENTTLDTDSENSENTIIDTDSENTTLEEKPEDSLQESYKVVNIENGDTAKEIAENLYELEIIDNLKDFENLIVELKVTKKMPYGEFLVPVGGTYNEVLAAIGVKK